MLSFVMFVFILFCCVSCSFSFLAPSFLVRLRFLVVCRVLFIVLYLVPLNFPVPFLFPFPGVGGTLDCEGRVDPKIGSRTCFEELFQPHPILPAAFP